MRKRKWTHVSLLDDLHSGLDIDLDRGGTWVFKEPRFGSASGVTPDLFLINRDYDEPSFTTYEVKATTSDLKDDVSRNKWKKYLKFSDQIYFAVPIEIKWKECLKHKPVGIIVRDGNGWSVVKEAPLNRKRIGVPDIVFMSILFRLDDYLDGKLVNRIHGHYWAEDAKDRKKIPKSWRSKIDLLLKTKIKKNRS